MWGFIEQESMSGFHCCEIEPCLRLCGHVKLAVNGWEPWYKAAPSYTACSMEGSLSDQAHLWCGFFEATSELRENPRVLSRLWRAMTPWKAGLHLSTVVELAKCQECIGSKTDFPRCFPLPTRSAFLRGEHGICKKFPDSNLVSFSWLGWT